MLFDHYAPVIIWKILFYEHYSCLELIQVRCTKLIFSTISQDFLMKYVPKTTQKHLRRRIPYYLLSKQCILPSCGRLLCEVCCLLPFSVSRRTWTPFLKMMISWLIAVFFHNFGVKITIHGKNFKNDLYPMELTHLD